VLQTEFDPTIQVFERYALAKACWNLREIISFESSSLNTVPYCLCPFHIYVVSIISPLIISCIVVITCTICFNIRNLCILPTQRIHVLIRLSNKQYLFSLNSFNRLSRVMEMQCIFSSVETDLKILVTWILRLKGLNGLYSSDDTASSIYLPPV
jgi:hypothetical protein